MNGCIETPRRSGLTLIELIVVLLVVAGLSGLLVPLFAGTIQNAQQVATRASLIQIRDALSEYWRDTKHVPLDGVTTVATESDRFDITWLMTNPVTGDTSVDFAASTRIGWRGPYLNASTGDAVAYGSPLMIDAWNQPIVVQDVDPTASLRDVRVVSGGPNGVVDVPGATATASLSVADIGDDLYVTLSVR